MCKIKDTKQKILDELYQVTSLDRKNTNALVEESLKLDTLQQRVKADQKDFYSSVELLHSTKEIYVDWKENLAIITLEGIVSLNSNKYNDILIKKRRETILYYLKVFGYSVIFITLVQSIIKLTEYFKTLM